MQRQATEFVKLLRRTIATNEFKDRIIWDEDLDPHSESERRVQLRLLGEEDEGRAVGEWIEDLD